MVSSTMGPPRSMKFESLLSCEEVNIPTALACQCGEATVVECLRWGVVFKPQTGSDLNVQSSRPNRTLLHANRSMDLEYYDRASIRLENAAAVPHPP